MTSQCAKLTLTFLYNFLARSISGFNYMCCGSLKGLGLSHQKELVRGLLCGTCYPIHISILRCVLLDIYTFPYTGCGSVINNTLKSPGYPAYSPNDIDCNYTVPIPHNLTMKISFTYFVLEDNSRCG